MAQRRWYNGNLPQTLVIAQLLLYFDAAFALLDMFTVGLNSRVSYTTLGRLLAVAVVILSVAGASGIANEKRRGYQIALAASFLPMITRVIVAAQGRGIMHELSFIFLGNSVLNVLFEYALIALLLHPMSRNHEKAWFT